MSDDTMCRSLTFSEPVLWHWPETLHRHEGWVVQEVCDHVHISLPIKAARVWKPLKSLRRIRAWRRPLLSLVTCNGAITGARLHMLHEL